MSEPKANISRVWKAVTPELAAEAEAFWVDNKAIPAQQARARAQQLVAVARDDSGALCGVTTVAVQQIPKLGLPCYYYRMFISPRHRSQFLARELLAETVRTLAVDPAVQQVNGPKGVFLEMHNRKIAAAIRDLVWKLREFEFVYVGQSETGHFTRVCYFPDLKVPPEAPARAVAAASRVLN